MTVESEPSIKSVLAEAKASFDLFLAEQLLSSMTGLDSSSNTVSLQYRVTPDWPTYRLVGVTGQPGETVLQIYLEICYELYHGEFHFKVRKVGSVERNRAARDLPLLLRLAFFEALMWRPTAENIWE